MGFPYFFNFRVEKKEGADYRDFMKTLALLATLLSLPSCAYQLGHSTRSLPEGHKTVFIEMFKNSSPELGAEASFTQALIHELQRSGFAVVTSKDAADLIIEGTLINIFSNDSSPISRFFTADHGAGTSRPYNATLFRSFDLNVQADLKAIRARDQKLIWQTSLNGRKTYRGSELTKQGVRSSNVLYNQSRRAQTIKLIAQEMMQEAFDRFTETF